MNQPSETRDPIGRCYVLSEDLTERDDLDGGEWKFCEGRPQGHEQFGFCQQGLSVSFTPDNSFILFGAPGTYNWKGNKSQHDTSPWFPLCFLSSLQRTVHIQWGPEIRAPRVSQDIIITII